MKDNKLLKIIASIFFGGGIGLCISVVTQRVLPGILVGVGLTICFIVVTNSNKKIDKF